MSSIIKVNSIGVKKIDKSYTNYLIFAGLGKYRIIQQMP